MKIVLCTTLYALVFAATTSASPTNPIGNLIIRQTEGDTCLGEGSRCGSDISDYHCCPGTECVQGHPRTPPRCYTFFDVMQLKKQGRKPKHVTRGPKHSS